MAEKHLIELVPIEITCIECGDKFNKFQGSMEERTCMTCILKVEDPDAIRPAPITKSEVANARELIGTR
mgnify:CR=1 FL=1